MKIIFKCKFGSHLYGTNTPESDQDFKAVYIPEERDIILQQVKKNINTNTKSGSTLKNNSEDIDFECFSLQEFLKLLCQGQAVALDMFFCNQENILIETPEWSVVKANKDKYLHKNLSAYVGYAKTQAAKYGLKGGRIASLRSTLDLLRLYKHEQLLIEIGMDKLNRYVIETEHISWVWQKGSQDKHIQYFQICGRKFELNSKICYVFDVLNKILENYGARALQAELNQNIDWKAVSHAYRVCEEAKELLLTHNITFPRPEKDLLLQIKLGKLPYNQVQEMIEKDLELLKTAQDISTLPNKPDIDFVEELVYNLYKEQINK